jgi:hypothetical protein
MESSSVSAKLSYRHVGENLYRRESSDVYYALIKKGGKQFRRSLKTKDLGLARRRLSELVSHDAGALTFKIVADRWMASFRHTIKESTAKRCQACIEALAPIFTGLSLRNITPTHCERWVTQRGDSIATANPSENSNILVGSLLK